MRGKRARFRFAPPAWHNQVFFIGRAAQRRPYKVFRLQLVTDLSFMRWPYGAAGGGLTGTRNYDRIGLPARAEGRTQTRRRLLLHLRKGVERDENYISSLELFNHDLREKDKKQPPLCQVTEVFVTRKSRNKITD